MKGHFIAYLDENNKIVEAHHFTYGFMDWHMRLEFIKRCRDPDGKYEEVPRDL